MKRLQLVTIALPAIAAMLACGGAFAQARGPSAQAVLADGQDVGNTSERGSALPEERIRALALEFDLDPDIDPGQVRMIPAPGGGFVLHWGKERIDLSTFRPPEEVFDDATRARKLAEAEIWLTRLPGRFRIEGRAERPGRMQTTLGGKVTGVADCESVGEGVGVQCIISATWPIIEIEVADIGGRPPTSEMLRAFGPAMLVVGLNPDSPEVRALLVTDDSLAHAWAGRLTEDTVTARRLTGCIGADSIPRDPRCFQPLEISAAPEGGIVTIVLRAGGVTITFAMHRDPQARAEKPLKRKKAR
jgi:hypothetical protein